MRVEEKHKQKEIMPEAAQEYSKSIETQPQAMQLYMFRAGCYVALKKNKEALADVATYQDLLKKSVDKNDKSILSTVALMQARAYDGLGRTKDALKSCVSGKSSLKAMDCLYLKLINT